MKIELSASELKGSQERNSVGRSTKKILEEVFADFAAAGTPTQKASPEKYTPWTPKSKTIVHEFPTPRSEEDNVIILSEHEGEDSTVCIPIQKKVSKPRLDQDARYLEKKIQKPF